MPTYEYVCKACRHELEEFQSMSAKPLTKCPACGKNALERKIGVGAGIIFKGGGFYETDYRSDSYKKAAEADSKPASSESNGHVHSGTCGCGKKPADQCGASSAGASTDKKPSTTEKAVSKAKPKSSKK